MASGMKGWTDIGSDVSWDEYGGKWAKRAPDGSYYVIDFTNMYEACGEDDCKRYGQAQYVCEVKRVNLDGLSDETIASALRCCGMRLENIDAREQSTSSQRVVSDQGDIIAVDSDLYRFQLVLVEACVSYGNVEPIESFSGDAYSSRIRADARRYAETCMKDAALLAERLARPVNGIGSTAEEYGRGDIDAAMNRGPFDTAKNLMRKLHGYPPAVE